MKSSILHKKFRAYTLLELLVGMILSSIVLTATFSAYRIITWQYKTFLEKSEVDSELSFFVSQFQFDFMNAENISRISENEILLQSKNKTFDYRFAEKFVLRNDFSRIDTFKVSVGGIETFVNTKNILSEKAEVDELRLKINFGEKKIEKTYLKSKSAKTELDNADIDLN